MGVKKDGLIVSAQALSSGTAALTALRGTDAWGANYVFNPSGLQTDIYNISDLIPGGAGTSTPVASGGLFISAGDSATGVFKLTVEGGTGIFTAV